MPSAPAESAGAPIAVGVPCSASPPDVESECTTVTEAYFAQINAQGGINGHQLKVVPCVLSPVSPSNCLQSFLSNSSIVAVVGGTDSSSFSALTANNPIAAIGPAPDAADDGTSPDIFPFSSFSEAGGSLGAVARYTETLGLKKPTLLECEYQACRDVQDALTSIYAEKGIKLNSIIAPIAAANNTTYVAAAQHASANPTLVASAGPNQTSMIQDAQSLGFKTTWGITFSCYDQDQQLTPLKAFKGVTIYCPSPFKSWTQVGGQMAATMKKYGPKTWDWNYAGVDNWVAAHMFVDDLKGIHGTVTRTSVISGMKKLTNFTNEFLPAPINFSKAGPSKLYPRYPNYLWYIYKVVNGKLVSATPKPITVPPVASS